MDAGNEGSETPLGACAMHPERSALISCARCGNFACAECVGDGEEADGQCPPCREREGDHRKLPWEQVEVPWWRGYFQTAAQALSAPSSAFDRSFRGDLGIAQRFGWLSGLVGYLPLIAIVTVLFPLVWAIGPGDAAGGASSPITMLCAVPCMMVLYPTFSFIYFTGMGLVLHALCSASGNKAVYEQSARAAYYAGSWELVSALALLLYIVPLVGVLLALGVTLAGVAWRTVAFRSFAMRAHGLSPGAATAAGFFAAACWQILGFVVIGIVVGLAIFRRFG